MSSEVLKLILHPDLYVYFLIVVSWEGALWCVWLSSPPCLGTLFILSVFHVDLETTFYTGAWFVKAQVAFLFYLAVVKNVFRVELAPNENPL